MTDPNEDLIQGWTTLESYPDHRVEALHQAIATIGLANQDLSARDAVALVLSTAERFLTFLQAEDD